MFVNIPWLISNADSASTQDEIFMALCLIFNSGHLLPGFAAWSVLILRVRAGFEKAEAFYSG